MQAPVAQQASAARLWPAAREVSGQPTANAEHISEPSSGNGSVSGSRLDMVHRHEVEAGESDMSGEESDGESYIGDNHVDHIIYQEQDDDDDPPLRLEEQEEGGSLDNLLTEADTAILAAALLRQQQLLFGQEGTARMNLTEEELQWAHSVKAAIESTADLDDLSDMMYAQYALVESGDLEAAVDRARMMQAFRHEYGVMDTIEEAQRCVSGLVDMMPGLLLSFSFNPRDGNYALVRDFCKFDMSTLTTPERVTSWLKGTYYLFHAVNPDLEAVRRGVTLLYECEGYQWKKNNMMDLKTFEKGWCELGAVYPCRFHQIRFFHTGVFFNLLASMAKRFLPFKIYNKFQLGCPFGYRLDTIYMAPTMKTANERLVARFEQALQRRYKQEQSYSLDNPKLSPSNHRI